MTNTTDVHFPDLKGRDTCVHGESGGSHANSLTNLSLPSTMPRGHFRSFGRNKSKYRYMTFNSTREKLTRAGSSSGLASISGSTQNLLDQAKVFSMQEDARSKKISSEVMKSRLYESVVTSPRKRRFSMRMDYCSNYASDSPEAQVYSRMVYSLPVTPAHSQNVTPSHSPTSERKFPFGFFSRGTTPHCVTPEEMEEESVDLENDGSSKGLASLFNPHPKYIPGAKISSTKQEDLPMDCELTESNTDIMGPPRVPGIISRSGTNIWSNHPSS